MKKIEVVHKKFGRGTVETFSSETRTLVVRFGEVEKKLQFPDAFESFLTIVDDPEFEKVVETALIERRAKLEEERKLKAEKDAKFLAEIEAARNENRSKKAKVPRRNEDAELVGRRAKGVPVTSESETFEIVGYLSSPNRLLSIEAEVPTDERENLFRQEFPDQKYRPIEMKETPCGAPNKLNPQFRLNLADVTNCPKALASAIRAGSGSCAARVNRSGFVYELVKEYGFTFGNEQDVDAIRRIAYGRGYADAFEKGYENRVQA